MVESLQVLFSRDLNRLKKEIESYKADKNLWKTSGEIKNSAGNLAIHLCGNLQHFIGAVLGNTGYERDREFEFNATDLSKEKIISEIEASIIVVEEVLPKLDEVKLQEHYPINVFDQELSNEYFLMHLYGHFNYHFGQINYHRRILDL